MHPPCFLAAMAALKKCIIDCDGTNYSNAASFKLRVLYCSCGPYVFGFTGGVGSTSRQRWQPDRHPHVVALLCFTSYAAK
jgi:hypothetical protein